MTQHFFSGLLMVIRKETISSTVVKIINKLPFPSKSMATPPVRGPNILPIPKATPAKIVPEGSKYLGNKSAIYEIPSENNEPTNIPANKKQRPSVKGVFIKIAIKKDAVPLNKIIDNTFFRPNRSLNIPSGICEIKLPITKIGSKIETL